MTFVVQLQISKMVIWQLCCVHLVKAQCHYHVPFRIIPVKRNSRWLPYQPCLKSEGYNFHLRITVIMNYIASSWEYHEEYMKIRSNDNFKMGTMWPSRIFETIFIWAWSKVKMSHYSESSVFDCHFRCKFNLEISFSGFGSSYGFMNSN